MYFSVVAYSHAYSPPTANEHRHYITGFAKTPDILANFICKWTANKILYIWFQHGLFLHPPQQILPEHAHMKPGYVGLFTSTVTALGCSAMVLATCFRRIPREMPGL